MEEEERQDNHFEVEGSYVEGDAKIDRGDFVGGDKFVGLGGKEVAQILDVLFKYFSQSYLKRPEQLDRVLGNYQKLHEQLYEWKEMHNHMDRILQAFEQFSTQVINAGEPLGVRELHNLWFPVNLCLDNLLEWAKKINCIGKSFVLGEDGELRGEIWAIDLENARKEIAAHLGVSSDSPGSGTLPGGPRLIRRLRYYLGLDANWWNGLVDLARRFRHIILQNMHFADKRLRETATELYHVSRGTLMR